MTINERMEKYINERRIVKIGKTKQKKIYREKVVL